MKLVPQRLFPSVIALLLACCAVPCTHAQAVYAAWRNHVWKLDPAGSATEVRFDFGEAVGESDERGTTYPVVSPDGKQIAFTRKNDLWLLHTETMQEQQITMVGKPQTSRYAAVQVFITAWAPDSGAFIYRVEAGITADDESIGPALIRRKAGYGPFACDVESGKTSATGYPGKLLLWLPEPPGDYLVEKGAETVKGSYMVRFFPGKPDSEPLLGYGISMYQLRLNPDGKRVLGLRDVVPGARVAIVELNLETKRTTQVAEGGWADIQWPQYSPSGKHISYLGQHPGKAQGTYGGDLFVDGKKVYSSDRAFECFWINDDTVGLCFADFTEKQNHTWKFVDVRTGKEKGPSAAL